MLQLNLNLLITIFNLIVLYLLLKKFLIGPLNKIMEQRQELIKSGLKNAETAQQEAVQLKLQYEAALKGARSESEQMMENARMNSKREYERIVQDADEKAGRMLKEAQATIAMEREQTMQSLRSEIAGLAMTAAEKIVGDRDQNNQALYDQFLKEKEVGEVHEKDTDNE